MHTKDVGADSMLGVMHDLVKAKFDLLTFFLSDDNRRFDFAIHIGGTKIYRVQAKTGRICAGEKSITFPACSTSYHYRENGIKYGRKGYVGEADFFGVHCAGNQKSYLVPIEDCPVSSDVRLHLEMPPSGAAG